MVSLPVRYATNRPPPPPVPTTLQQRAGTVSPNMLCSGELQSYAKHAESLMKMDAVKWHPGPFAASTTGFDENSDRRRCPLFLSSLSYHKARILSNGPLQDDDSIGYSRVEDECTGSSCIQLKARTGSQTASIENAARYCRCTTLLPPAVLTHEQMLPKSCLTNQGVVV